MYLKRLEMIGFKSFAEKTRLEFGPGMMAIVGPNGCGKSNIADAVRWVLGEQSAKALRGAKMEDCIFAGTDTHKPLGMAEVSLTLADCEDTLGTAFNEVTVTRRVHRSGEGHYLINQAPCRLRDIQRLFMDTGIGTNSYSLMEQGRIDRILSSRPEDRRSVFEEASGITKYKADRKEALRKLDHTDANLLRLADILREVKRQIISLQRQAGKARRFQALQEELRTLDLFFTKERLAAMDRELADLDARRASFSEREEAAAEDVHRADEQLARARAELTELARSLDAAREAVRDARGARDRAQDTLRLHGIRVDELQERVERDERGVRQAEAALAEQRETASAAARDHETADAARNEAEALLQRLTERQKASEDAVDTASRALHALRNESLELDRQVAARQKEAGDLDARERSARLQRERLLAERATLQRDREQREANRVALAARVAELQRKAEGCAAREQALRARRAERRDAIARIEAALRPLRDQAAERAAQVDLLRRSEREAEGFPGGARLLLDPEAVPGNGGERILGALAGQLTIAPEARRAVEAVLRPWLDAVVIRDADDGVALLDELARARAGSARLLAVRATGPATPPAAPGHPGEPLAHHVQCEPDLAPLRDRLLAGVYLVPRLDGLPSPLPPGTVFVTPDGLLAGADGAFACWLPEAEDVTPLARRAQRKAWTEDHARIRAHVAEHEARLAALHAGDEADGTADAASRTAMDEARRALALAEGELGVLERDARKAAERLETVDYELEAMEGQDTAAETQRAELHRELEALHVRQEQVRRDAAAHTERLHELEQTRTARLQASTDARIALAECRQEVDRHAQREAAARLRMGELETRMREHAAGIAEGRTRIDALEREAAAARESLGPMEAAITEKEQECAGIGARHTAVEADLTRLDAALRAHRQALEGFQRSGAQADVERAERRTRRQALVERVTADYRVTAEAILEADIPRDDAGDVPEREVIETRIAELRARLDALGPVNLVAIDEFKELEERHAFLSAQHDDLVRSKEQLIDTIRRINQTTTALFAETFEKVNAAFSVMFERIFGGGTARLVMVDEEDVLESGIEIIARPPGKKLQSVSLLSGGERTMAAVALLFALYQVKPSPFCVLDELDAALDDANIGRFVDVVKDFVTQSQFIVITHNRQTIAAAHALYGVTMPQRGVSRIVSVRFNRDGRVAGDADAETAEAETAAAVPAAT